MYFKECYMLWFIKKFSLVRMESKSRSWWMFQKEEATDIFCSSFLLKVSPWAFHRGEQHHCQGPETIFPAELFFSSLRTSSRLSLRVSTILLIYAKFSWGISNTKPSLADAAVQSSLKDWDMKYWNSSRSRQKLFYQIQIVWWKIIFPFSF